MLADARFSVLLDCVETHANKLDKLGLERRKWSYAKLALPSEYRMRAALSVRLLDRAKDLQGDLMDATDAGFILNRVEEQYDVFNKVNASTALHRLARVITQPNFGSNNNNSKKRAAKSRTVKSTTVVNTLGVSWRTTTGARTKRRRRRGREQQRRRRRVQTRIHEKRTPSRSKIPSFTGNVRNENSGNVSAGSFQRLVGFSQVILRRPDESEIVALCHFQTIRVANEVRRREVFVDDFVGLGGFRI